ncbi:MAG: Na+/H+ antiporter subunit E [Thermodesulfovibrio sp.]|uniref:Na+/H+ antiporter subunit E n=1 Tax=unclassified Thermodesulfovibrio TaxID=2645936 RepID=UPI00083A0FBB|nr:MULTISPECIES: Na+/H+ antiporter subunit E [unclassified Thermodesulfovibrio]MDI1472247.1 Na+/H+ antiporter subunit E [Thermodesulfovibrio sp. 1176]MDI6714109.1 Na+/H+ antiporter subunit E [Thermodesulfovibrio sp.]ODA44627.1 Cation antiporter precursor [Thermodesulfovibrio sp. N1]
MRREIVTFLILFLLWLIFSGMFDAFHLALGVVSCLIVTLISGDLIFQNERFTMNHIKEGIRFIKYLPWLIYQIILANIHVAYLVLHPKMPIEPIIIAYKAKLKRDISKVVFSQSIILTPGTITMDIVDDTFIVHCISKKVADDLFTGEMEQRIADVFERENTKRSL